MVTPHINEFKVNKQIIPRSSKCNKQCLDLLFSSLKEKVDTGDLYYARDITRKICDLKGRDPEIDKRIKTEAPPLIGLALDKSMKSRDPNVIVGINNELVLYLKEIKRELGKVKQ